MEFRAPLGISDFRKLRQSRRTYVDKTAFISDVLGASADAQLIPRPRRFGKTLNLSTLRYFLERSDEDRSALFSDLEVWKDERARLHFQRHPVLFISFKDVRYEGWEAAWSSVHELIAELFQAHAYLLDGGALGRVDASRFERMLSGEAKDSDLAGSLRVLSRLLAIHHGERVAILIDEYDTPIHAGLMHGYYDRAVTLFRNLLSGALKDNEHLFRGVVTGILRVAKESVFSGLNNLSVYSLLRPELSTAFGFTEPEVEALAAMAGGHGALDDLRRWYNGYDFGGTVIYNPWSVLSFLDRGARRFEPFWVSTSANDLVDRALLGRGPDEAAGLEQLLRGEPIERAIDEHISLRDLRGTPDAIWSLLLFSGYLTASDVRYDDDGVHARLSIPNLEVAQLFRRVFRQWLTTGAGGDEAVRALTRAMLEGDAANFEARLGDLLRETTSFHDTGGPAPERVYHAFVLGLLVHIGADYDVRSNRESGYGRCDVLVLPKQPGRPGVALELKTARDPESLDDAVAAAGAQLRDRDYASELRARGASPIHEIAAAFDGKRIRVAAVSRG